MPFATRLPGFAQVLLLSTALLAQAASAQNKPALVRDIDRRQAQPVSGHCSANVCDLYTVPPGKRLTVTLVSHVALTSGNSIVFAGVTYSGAAAGGAQATLFFVEPGTLISASGQGIQQKVQPVDVVLDEGTVFRAGTTRFNGDPNMTISFSGYLVDK